MSNSTDIAWVIVINFFPYLFTYLFIYLISCKLCSNLQYNIKIVKMQKYIPVLNSNEITFSFIYQFIYSYSNLIIMFSTIKEKECKSRCAIIYGLHLFFFYAFQLYSKLEYNMEVIKVQRYMHNDSEIVISLQL